MDIDVEGVKETGINRRFYSLKKKQKESVKKYLSELETKFAELVYSNDDKGLNQNYERKI